MVAQDVGGGVGSSSLLGVRGMLCKSEMGVAERLSPHFTFLEAPIREHGVARAQDVTQSQRERF